MSKAKVQNNYTSRKQWAVREIYSGASRYFMGSGRGERVWLLVECGWLSVLGISLSYVKPSLTVHTLPRASDFNPIHGYSRINIRCK